jgi:hypothetical protein
MKIFLAVVVLLLVSAVGVAAQDHAVMPEQCRADVRLWHAQSKTANDKLSFDDLEQRSLEMWNCQSIDVGTGEGLAEFKSDMDNYRLLWTAYTAVSAQRLHNFIERHGLGKQFKDEDAAGQR